MFTGIISGLGKVTAVDRIGVGDQYGIIVLSPYDDCKEGESVSVNGVCLTVVPSSTTDMTSLNAGGTFTASKRLHFYVSPETLDKTSFKDLKVGTSVNLERALKLDDRLSGHLVQGHVDGVGEIISIENRGAAYEIGVRLDEAMLPLTIEKGSIALDGISLTINKIVNSYIYLMIIPHTWTHTNLHLKQVGQHLNVELDMVAKYIRKWTRS
jgi:riboflavin synthase